MEEDNKYSFAREILFSIRSSHGMSQRAYLFWIDKLITDEKNCCKKYTESEMDDSYDNGFKDGVKAKLKII